MPSYARATSLFLDRYQLNPGRPDLEMLGEISLCFAELPWENLTKLLAKHRPQGAATPRLPPSLRGVAGAARLRLSEEVIADHERLGTGGTCFSLTNALRRIVSDLGYDAHPVMADMRTGANVHCGLLVRLDGRRYLLDPGYLVAEPVPLDAGGPTYVGLAGSRLEYTVSGRDEIALHGRDDRGGRLLRYRMRLGPVPEADFVRFWIASFDARGMNGLHLNRLSAEGRLSVHDLNLRIDTGHGKRNVTLRGRFVEQVAGRFGVDAGLVRRAFAKWEKLRCSRE